MDDDGSEHSDTDSVVSARGTIRHCQDNLKALRGKKDPVSEGLREGLLDKKHRAMLHVTSRKPLADQLVVQEDRLVRLQEKTTSLQGQLRLIESDLQLTAGKNESCQVEITRLRASIELENAAKAQSVRIDTQPLVVTPGAVAAPLPGGFAPPSPLRSSLRPSRAPSPTASSASQDSALQAMMAQQAHMMGLIQAMYAQNNGGAALPTSPFHIGPPPHGNIQPHLPPVPVIPGFQGAQAASPPPGQPAPAAMTQIDPSTPAVSAEATVEVKQEISPTQMQPRVAPSGTGTWAHPLLIADDEDMLEDMLSLSSEGTSGVSTPSKRLGVKKEVLKTPPAKGGPSAKGTPSKTSPAASGLTGQ